TFTLPADNTGSERRNKRLTLTLGNGSARVELESFGGTIALRRPGEARPETERRRRSDDHINDKQKDKDKPIGLAGLEIDLSAVIAEAQASIPAAIAEAQAAMPEAMEAMDEALDAIRDMTPWVLPVPNAHPTPLPTPAPRPRR